MNGSPAPQAAAPASGGQFVAPQALPRGNPPASMPAAPGGLRGGDLSQTGRPPRRPPGMDLRGNEPTRGSSALGPPEPPR
jgi:hypothetical protein